MLLRTLGELALQGSDFSRPKPLLLLAYLALEGRTSRRFLADLFWMDAGNPRDALSTTIRRLRRVDERLVHVDGDCLMTGVACDAAHVLHAPMERWLDGGPERVLEAHPGSFCEGIDIPLGVDLEEWVFDIRERLARRACDIWLVRAEAEAHAGRTTLGRDLAERAWALAKATAMPDDVVIRAARCLAATESPLAGHAHVEAQELGVDLDDVADLRPGPALPPALDRFVGRDRELRKVADWLRSGEGRLLTIHGIGGIGKTRLALEVARREAASESFADGVAFVVLEDVRDASQISGALGQCLGVDLDGAADPLGRIVRWIGSRRMLLVLDNFEQVLPNVEPVQRLLTECPHVVLVVTSRERLRLRAERVLGLEGLDGQDPSEIGTGRSLPEAIELFLDRAQRFTPMPERGREELRRIAELCRVVGGSPLAIELAAGWAGVMTTEELRAAFERDVAEVRRAHVDRGERHASVSAAFEVTWDRLPSDLRVKLGRLSVFRGGIDRGFAERIAEMSIQDHRALVDRALLRVVAPGRFDMHPLVRAFAADKIAEDSDRLADARDMHAETFLTWAHGLQERIGRVDQAEVLRKREREIENIRAAWRWAVTSRRIEWIEAYAWAVSDAFDERSLDGALLFEASCGSLADAPSVSRSTLAILEIERARHLEAVTEYQMALDLIERATPHIGAKGVDDSIPRARFTLGKLLIRKGEYRRAREVLTLPGWSLPGELEETDDRDVPVPVPTAPGGVLRPRYHAALLAALAYLDMRSRPLPPGQLVQRLDDMETELRALGIAEFIPNILTGTGWYLLQNVGVDPAAPKFLAANDLRESLGPNWIEPYTVHGLATVALERGGLQSASALYDEAMHLAAQRGDAYLISHIEAYVARLWIRRGDWERSRRHLELALELSREHEIVPHLLFAVFVGAEWLAERGLVDEAKGIAAAVAADPHFEDPRSVSSFLDRYVPADPTATTPAQADRERDMRLPEPRAGLELDHATAVQRSVALAERLRTSMTLER